MLSYRTAGFNGYAVQFSPFLNDRLAVASAANFGLVGNGRLHVLRLTPRGTIDAETSFDTQDGQFDLAWSESHENHVYVGCGDGSLKLFDTARREFPLRSWREHSKEVFSVCCNIHDKTTLATASWDGTVRLWHPERSQSLQTLPQGPGCVCQADFSPHDGHMLATVSADGLLRVWDLRAAAAQGAVASVVSNHGEESLCLDWAKYSTHTLVSGGVDTRVMVWDLRALHQPRAECIGHRFAVRTVRTSNHRPNVLASGGYDMSVRIWEAPIADDSPQADVVGVRAAPRFQFDQHTEFVTSVDWSLWGDGSWIASAGWDEAVHVFQTGG